jgi:urocanate hydratase
MDHDPGSAAWAAQPLAVTMNGGVAICVDCDQSRITRRIEHGYDQAAEVATQRGVRVPVAP